MRIRRLVPVLLAACAVLRGQTVSTQILGLVTDPGGAVIPGATITARRVATGDTRTTASNETGNFIFPLLDIGQYEVTCAAAGFKTELRSNIVLQLQDKLRLDFQMKIGQQAETVEVSGTAALLRTEDATLGSVVEQRRIVELPLNGRNFGQLATLMPGVVYGTSRMGLDGQQTIGTRAMPGQIVGLSANGQRDINQNITLDGVTATEDFKAAMLFVPSIEAIQEFKIQSAVYSAEFGMNSGAQANVAIKSGTNTLHATLFEFLRNDQLDARGFFLQPGADKNRLRRNQYGGVASGRIRKDKSFWLVNYEARRERRGTPSRQSVPTLAMRAGDFSEFLQAGNRWYPRDANPAAARSIRLPSDTLPFPGNIVPANLISPVSKNLLTWKNSSPFAEGGFMPFPNYDAQARAAGNTLNRVGTSDQQLDSDQALGRFDHRFGDNDRIFARYVIVESSWVQNPLQRTTRGTVGYRAQNLGVGYTKIISPTVLNELRFGHNRIRANAVAIQTDTDFTHRDLGFDFRVVGDGNRQLTKFEEGLPNIGITGYTGIGSANLSRDTNRVFEGTDNVSINRGKHNFKFGGLLRTGPVDFAGSNNPRGVLSFTQDIVGIPDGFAAFLLGYPLSANSAEGAPPGFIRQKKMGFYALNDFKATAKLTVNFGLRWDWFGPVTDAKGRIRNVSFEPSAARTINGFFAPALVPNPGVSQQIYDINWKQFMPRLGIAYRVSDTLVLRTGAGQFYSPQQQNNFSILNINPPFSGSVVFQNDRARPTATIASPFLGSPVGGGPQALIMLGNLQADRSNRSLYLNNDIWQWTLEIEKGWGKDFVTGVAYVGSKASNLDMGIQNWNNPDPGLGAVQARRPIQFYVDSRNRDTLLPLGTLRRLETGTSANYNALQMRAEKRYSKGLTFHAAFNYQKAMTVGYSVNENGLYGANFTQDPRNRLADYGRSYIDQRFRFVFSHVWELPWMRGAKGPAGWVLGGWAVNGIIQLTAGLPVTVSQTGDSQNTGTPAAARPHVITGQAVGRVMEGRTLDRWFNTAAFVRSKCDGCAGEGLFAGSKGYGNSGVALFDAPAQKTWDFALFKEFKVKERHKVQFRWETFNLLNTPQFSAPSRSLGAADFGRISGTSINNREMQFGLKYSF